LGDFDNFHSSQWSRHNISPLKGFSRQLVWQADSNVKVREHEPIGVLFILEIELLR
jgi:hypothetical protein